MNRSAHTPYDGSARPFTIGLRPMVPAEWIETDADLGDYLAEKDRQTSLRRDLVFAEEEATREAQREALDMLAAYLPARYPDIYRGRENGRAIEIPGLGREVRLDAADLPPLEAAARLVQEDLVLMRRDETGWRLVAASLCFPSSWSLREKFARPLQDIHRPVPAFGPGTRNATVIERIFDKLDVARTVERMNWSFQDDGTLYHPLGHGRHASERRIRFADGHAAAARAFVRVERQTLRKLPASGDILFTIRIYLDPLRRLREHPDHARIASGFAAQLAGLKDDQLDYKGLRAARDELLAALGHIAAA